MPVVSASAEFGLPDPLLVDNAERSDRSHNIDTDIPLPSDIDCLVLVCSLSPIFERFLPDNTGISSVDLPAFA